MNASLEPNTVGTRLKKARETAGLTVGQLAKAIGTSRSAIAQVELGLSNSLNAENLAKAAQVLGKNAVWLASGKGPEDHNNLLGDAVASLPAADQQQIFDFILYKIERAPVPYADEPRSKGYTDMIERFKLDMEQRRNR